MQKKLIFLIIVCFIPIVSRAELETFELKISVFQQSCKRTDATKPYGCTTSQENQTKSQITLTPTNPDPLEDEAYKGASGDFWTSVPSEGQFILNASIYKSVSFGGKVVQYSFWISSRKFTDALTPIFTISARSSNGPILPSPLILLADRYEPNERYFTQIFYNIEISNP